MLLMNNVRDSLDMVQYKLILAAICSKVRMGEAFEHLVEVSYKELERAFSRAATPLSPVEIFRAYLESVSDKETAQKIIHVSYDKLFSLDVNNILPELFDTYHMDRKVFRMLNSLLSWKLTESDWQHLKNRVLKFLKRECKLDAKFCGEGSNLFAMINSSVRIYVKGNEADLYSFINKTSMNVVNENDFSISMLNIESLSEGGECEIDFPEVMRSVQRLNWLLYTHAPGRMGRIYFYDLLSYYKNLLLEQYFAEIDGIFKSVFRTGISRFVMICDDKKPLRDASTGIAWKFQTCDKLIQLLNPIVMKGLSPDDVNMYVEKIYRHAVSSKSASASAIFTFNSVDRNDNYNTGTAFVKAEEGHGNIRAVLEGFVALHHLFMYLSSHKINIFDLASEVFMDDRFLHRFETVEEVVTLYQDTMKLMSRPEDANLFELCEKNRLPLNDDVLNYVGVYERLESSIAFADISDAMGDLTVSGLGRSSVKQNRIDKILGEFCDLFDVIKRNKQSLESLEDTATFGGTTVKIPVLQFIKNLSERQDLVSAMEIEVFQRVGLRADLACVLDEETGYYKTPEKDYNHYCMNHSAIIALTKTLHSQSTASPDAILEVYRCSSFFMSMWDVLTLVEDELDTLTDKFATQTQITTATGNRKVGRVPMGLFDAYGFVSQFRLACSLRSMEPLEAIKSVAELMGTDLFITATTSADEALNQLIKIYNLFLGVFAKTLERLEKIMDSYYSDFANKLGGGYSLAGDEAFFEAAKKLVDLEMYMNTSAGFTRFASGCTRTMKGFLKRNGKLVTKVMDDTTMFLSERGIWVGRASTGNYITATAVDTHFVEVI